MKTRSLSVGLLVLASIPALANPTGGVVSSGSATINPATGKTLTVDQTSQNAVINWQSFSIGAGETTKFVQPNSASAVLNRVLGGGTSTIAGTLSANGQVLLINGNGIYISATGKVNTNGFIASTQDIADSDFLAGNLHFSGNSAASVQNLGTVSALGGNIYFIGQQVSNGGTLSAPKGTVGLAAGTDVVVAQHNADGSTVTVNPTSATSAINGTGVTNTGKISAAMAELRAANGNIYALAINNSGAVRATGVSNKNGHIWLVANGGSVKSTGSLTTSAAGAIETSADYVNVSGTVNSGKGGKWTIDPSDVVISTAASPNNLNTKTIDGELNAGSSVSIEAVGSPIDSGTIDVNAPIVWTSTASLSLTASDNLNINSAITGKGGLIINATNHIFAGGAISIGSFDLQTGLWSQIIGQGGLTKLPTFAVTGNFAIDYGATFARFAGGDGGANPFQIVDVYGLQGIATGTGSINLQADNYILKNAINATVTKNWNSGAGFVPIVGFSGVFNGNKQSLIGLTINPTAGTVNVGLFATTTSSTVVENLNLVAAALHGEQNAGILVGDNSGTISGCSVSGSVIGVTDGSDLQSVGGIVGANEATGAIFNCTSAATLTIPVDTSTYTVGAIGGFVGTNLGQITTSASSGKLTFNGTNLTGAPNLFLDLGGFCGSNDGAINSCSNSGALAINVANVEFAGGLVGVNEGAINFGNNAGAVILSDNGTDIGGLVGQQTLAGTTLNATNTGAVTISGPDASSDVGGLIGAMDDTASISTSTNHGTLTLTATAGHLDSDIGGIVGSNDSNGNIVGCLNTGAISLNAAAAAVGGIVGSSTGGGSANSCANTGAIKDITTAFGIESVGGVGGEFETGGAINLSTSTGAITAALGDNVGGVVGVVGANTSISNSSNAGVITLGAGSSTAGGVAGEAGASSQLLNCSNSAAINVTFNSSLAGTDDLGGIVGINGAALTNCSNTGALTLKDSSVSSLNAARQVGGITGDNLGTVTSCSNAGKITIAGINDVDISGGVGVNTGQIFSSSNSGAVTVAELGAINVGGVVGLNNSGSTTGVRSISNSGVITVGNNATNVGGGIGQSEAGIAEFVSNIAIVKGGTTSSFVGGDIGNITGGTAESLVNSGLISVSTLASGIGGSVGRTDVSIFDAVNSGTVTGTSGSQYGGVLGLLDTDGSLQLAYNTGSVTTGATTSNTGGLIGANLRTTNGAVEFTYSTGKVTSKGTGVGGLIGFNATPGVVLDSYWNVQSSGQATSAGGTSVATTALMQTPSTYVGFDFAGTWGINPGGTPFLITLQVPHVNGP